ncbi:hypothetical protein FA95DRAFT_1592993 [Auriscalpium vulgare]|uniref:Uncharacterized protein n=1 Tax=Auriscalpium vulgare TaxID=40419 RepID=A0ACB8S7P7_9AGAM|nr:hypothetical protein FA95DRAFT_1592993 [Auriscalpium vulgare]
MSSNWTKASHLATAFSPDFATAHLTAALGGHPIALCTNPSSDPPNASFAPDPEDAGGPLLPVDIPHDQQFGLIVPTGIWHVPASALAFTCPELPVWFVRARPRSKVPLPEGVRVDEIVAGRGLCPVEGALRRVRMHGPCPEICIAWQGYHEYRVPVQDIDLSDTITVDSLVRQIAAAVDTFLHRHATRRIDAPPTPRELIIGGNQSVRATDVTITGAVNVEEGKWYPVLRVVHGRGVPIWSFPESFSLYRCLDL